MVFGLEAMLFILLGLQLESSWTRSASGAAGALLATGVAARRRW